MRQRGLDVSRDHVYPGPGVRLPGAAGDRRSTSRPSRVGVMAYYGTNDERKQADEIYASLRRRDEALCPVAGRQRPQGPCCSWGTRTAPMAAWCRRSWPTCGQTGPISIRQVSWPRLLSSYADVMRVLLPVGSVVAIRYHNVLCALKLSKPTIAIGYSPKHDALMADMGLPEFCQAVNALDIDQLIKLFTELESRSAELRQTMTGAQRGEERGSSTTCSRSCPPCCSRPRAQCRPGPRASPLSE